MFLLIVPHTETDALVQYVTYSQYPAIFARFGFSRIKKSSIYLVTARKIAARYGYKWAFGKFGVL